MKIVRNRKKSFEALTSIFLILVLIIIGLGILIKQSDAELTRFGIYTMNLHEQKPITTAQQTSILESVVPGDFVSLSEIEKYNPDNLYEKINGKAPTYLDAGFVELTAQRFVSKDDENLWMEIEIFDMANHKNSFSVFSVQRRPDAIIFGDLHPQYEYGTDNALFLRIGQYYIEIVGSAKSEKLLETMTEISQNLKKKLLVDPVTDIAELGLFPDKDIIAGSKKLHLKNAYGFEGLTDVFACQYKINDEILTAFLSRCNDNQAAEAKADSYYKFLLENGAGDKAASNEILKNNPVKVLDFYGTTEIIFSTGPFIGGIHEADNQDSAEVLAGDLYEKLNQQIINDQTK